MTILVTGASGFLGGRLVNALTRKNKKVRILARKTSNLKNIDSSKVEIKMGDITDISSIHGIMNDVELVYHCAAKIGVGRAKDFYSVNVNGTENLLEEAIRCSVSHFVYVSSVAVMDEYQDHFGCNENEPYASSWTEPYTPSKIEAEKRALCYGKTNNLKVTVIRPGWIWGPGDINTAKITKAVMSGLLPYVGTGDNTLSLTYIQNIVYALILAGESDCTSSENFIIADGQEITQKQFISAFVDRLNPNARPVSVPFQLAYNLAYMYEAINSMTRWRLDANVSRHSTCVAAKNFQFSLEKANKILGYKPLVSFETAVDETIKWLYDRYLDKDSKWSRRTIGELAPITGRTSMVHFAITSWCNAGCVFCSYPDSNQRISVDLPNAIKAINALKTLGVSIISLTGGEPFLNKDIFRIAFHASSIGMLVFTGTNGSIMTEDDAYRLRRSGVRAFWISYEGPDYETFDKNRGIPGLSEMIMKDLKWLKNAGVETFAICVLNKSIKDYRRFIDHLIEIGFDKVKFDYPMINQESGYLGFKDIDLIRYTRDEIIDVIKQILELKRSKYRNFGIINPTAGLEGAINFYNANNPRYSCSAGYKIFYLDWNLDLYRCTRLPEKFGKIWEVSKEQFQRIDCNKCYYQGTRDYDSIYYLLDSIKNAGSMISRGNLGSTLSSLMKKDNLSGLSSILEIASI